MSIVIKGMEIPKEDEEIIIRISPDGVVMTQYALPITGAKAVPVPPHGRLIDADAYEEILRGLGSRDYRREKGTICDAIKFLQPHYAPTIIEAEFFVGE